MAESDQSPRPLPSHLSLQGPAHPGARLSRNGMAADGMYVWECSSEGPVISPSPGGSCGPPIDLRPLSPNFYLWPQVDIGPIPRAESS